MSRTILPGFLRLKVPVEAPVTTLVSADSVPRASSGGRQLRKPRDNQHIDGSRDGECSTRAATFTSHSRRCKGCTIPRSEEQLEWYIVKYVKISPAGIAIPMRVPELENTETRKKMCYCSDRCVALRIHEKYIGAEINKLMNNLHVLKLSKFGYDTEILPAPNPRKLCFYVEGGMSVEEYDRLLASDE